jgi:predicted hotdog family 3-hydroxylacyl-ACP dehydratase
MMNELGHLYAKLPHSGAMCLLDRVLDWDPESIRCTSTSHCSPDNPLRRDGILSAAHAVEYAAQAAALHGVLGSVLDGGPVLLLAAVRDLRLDVTRLDTLPRPLRISAVLRGRSGANAIYVFRLESAGALCASGAITLMQDVGPRQ